MRAAEVKRRDAADIELQLFTGLQGSALPYKLSDTFEIRFAAKPVDGWAGGAVVLDSGFAWRPNDQVYAARPSFNTEQLNELFEPVEGVEPESVKLMAEFTWRDLAAPDDWTSTVTFELVVKNDVIRGDEGDPTNADNPSIYVTKAELGTGYVKTTEAQSLSDDQKAQARANIGAIADGDMVKVTAQSLSPTEKAQARANIDAAGQADLDATDATAAALALTVAGKASGADLSALNATVGALNGAALKKTAQSLSPAEKAQARANIGAAADTGEQRIYTRLAATWNAVGSGTKVDLNGALNVVAGTAVARPVNLLAAAKSVTGYTGSTITCAAHGGANGQPCQFSGTLLPAGLTAGTWYYLRDVAVNTFRVASSVGGAAIALSGSFTSWEVLLGLGPFFRHRRVGYRSSGSAGASCGTRHNVLQWAVSDDPALGGWTYSVRFGVSDAAAVANARLFAGMVGRTTALPNGNPSAQPNIVGVGADTADVNLHIMHNDGSGAATRVDLGAGFPANTLNTTFYQLVLTCNADMSVTYRVTNLSNAAEAQGNLITNLPHSLQLLAPQVWRNNGGTAKAVGIDVVQWTLEQAR